MPRASRTATQAEETERAVNSTKETEKQQKTANTNATEGRFIYIGPTTNTGLVENTIFTGSRAEICRRGNRKYNLCMCKMWSSTYRG